MSTLDLSSSISLCGRRPTAAGAVRGSVLILTLWALAILAALAVASAAHLSGVLRLARFLDNDVHAALAARAGVEMALMYAVSETNAWDTTSATAEIDAVPVGPQGRVRLVHHLPSGEARAGILGEEARISLNILRGRASLLAALFRVAPQIDGLPADTIHPDEAGEWTDLLLQYRDTLVEERDAARENTGLTDSGRFPHNDASDGVPFEPSGFRSWHEVMHTAEWMAREEGIDWFRLRAVLLRIRPYSTLYGTGRVHFDGAGEVVLAAVAVAAGAQEREARTLAGKIMALRPAEGFGKVPRRIEGLTADENSRLRMMARFLTDQVSCFGGTAEGWVEMNGPTERRFAGPERHAAPPLTRRIDFVVQPEPPGVLYWYEY